jgi:hypothetical protein
VESLDFQRMRQRESEDWSYNQALHATPVSAGLVALSRRPGVPELDRSPTDVLTAQARRATMLP